MSCTKFMLPPATLGVLVLIASYAVATPFTFDDIEYWAGTGTNSAALMIDWAEDNAEPPALAWGYRWDGEATGYEMLLAIVAADNRLFAKLGDFYGLPVVYGFGYDADGNGQFGVLKTDLGGEPIETEFDEFGFAFSEIPDEDRRTATAIDVGDYYAEGWFTGFWHYGTASTNPYDGGSWDGTPPEMTSRDLSDGAWDSWTFTPTFDFTAFAENPEAAPAPSEQLLGDYSQNDAIDAADYTVWRDTVTAASNSLPNDPTPGTVDESDFLYWREHFGGSLGSGASDATSVAAIVPEPSAWQLVVIAFLAGWKACPTVFRQRKEND